MWSNAKALVMIAVIPLASSLQWRLKGFVTSHNYLNMNFTTKTNQIVKSLGWSPCFIWGLGK